MQVVFNLGCQNPVKMQVLAGLGVKNPGKIHVFGVRTQKTLQKCMLWPVWVWKTLDKCWFSGTKLSKTWGFVVVFGLLCLSAPFLALVGDFI
jgi:hypothetical protein